MEAVASNENEGSFTSRPIELSIFPGIYKYGNEMCHDVSNNLAGKKLIHTFAS